MSAPTSVFANTPTASGTTITFTATAVGATSYVFNMYQLTSSSTTLVGSSPQTVTTSSGTATTTYSPAVAGAAYMFTVVAYNGAVAAGIVYSPTLFYAVTIVGGPQGVQGNPGAGGLQGPQGPTGVQGPQGLQGIISVNAYVGANSLITSGYSPGIVNAQSGLTYGGTTGTFGVAATTAPNINTVTIGAPTTATCNALYAAGSISATSINNGAATFTVSNNSLGTNTNTLTVSVPTTTTCNAIYTAGTINAAGTNAHTFGPITLTNGAIAGATTIGASGAITAGSTSGHTLGPISFTNGAIAGVTTIGASGAITAGSGNAHTLGPITFTNGVIAGVTTISNSGSVAMTAIGEAARPVANIYATTFTGNLNGTASNANAVPYSGVSGITSSSTFAGTAANANVLNATNGFKNETWYTSSESGTPVNRLYFGSNGYTYINGPASSGIAFQVGNNTMATLTTSFYANGGLSTNSLISGPAVQVTGGDSIAVPSYGSYSTYLQGKVLATTAIHAPAGTYCTKGSFLGPAAVIALYTVTGPGVFYASTFSYANQSAYAVFGTYPQGILPSANTPLGVQYYNSGTSNGLQIYITGGVGYMNIVVSNSQANATYYSVSLHCPA
jgi:hypothetical protein